MYAQLLIDLFKYLAPFLRNVELNKPMQILYKVNLESLFGIPKRSPLLSFQLTLNLFFRALYVCSWSFFMTSQNSCVIITMVSVMLYHQTASNYVT